MHYMAEDPAFWLFPSSPARFLLSIIAVFIGIPSGSLVYELKLNASVFVITVTNMYF